MKALLSLISASAVLAATTLTSYDVAAANKKIDQRWFEVEVILFRQLGDKRQLKETFGQNTTLPNYPIFDLLTPYNHPVLSEIKAHLPSCDAKLYPADMLTESAQLPPYFESLSLTQIETDIVIEEQLTALTNNSQESIDTLSNTYGFEQSGQDTTESNGAVTTELNAAQIDDSFTDEVSEVLVGLTEIETQLITGADAHFSPIQFVYSNVKPAFFTYKVKESNRRQNTICRHIDDNPLVAHSTNDGFPIDELTGRVDGNEFVYTDNPYLIDSDSLQLKDIYLQLRRSKNFRPMLHLGWRQSLINRKPASKNKALKIVAGEHFQQQYVDQQNDYEKRLNELSIEQWVAQQQQAIEASLNELADEQTTTDDELLSMDDVSPRALKTHAIFERLKALDITQQQLLAELDNPNLHADVLTQLKSDESLVTEEIKEPTKPVQPWYIDGLFRLHLSHYLYITADFNVSSHTAAELATQALTQTTLDAESDKNEWQSIPFRQNRRVISGEVHYFDHPYMGMVVQIRRYKKPEPEIEEEINQ